MQILLLGATGFVGECLLAKLCKIDNVVITATIHHKEPKTLYKNVQYIKRGIRTIDYDFLKKGNYDLIFHLARIPGKRYGDLGRFYAGLKGYAANRKLVKNIERLDIKPTLIYLSGSLMYGNNPGRIVDEKKPLNPSGYGKYYYYAEKPILNAVKHGRHNVLVLRAPWILGNGSWFHQLYLNRIKTEKILPVYGNVDRVMSIITVADCANLLWHYANNAPNGIYNIYTFNPVRYGDFITMIASAFNVPVKYYDIRDLEHQIDRTTLESICSEIVLTTTHKQMLDSCKPEFTDLELYIKALAASI